MRDPVRKKLKNLPILSKLYEYFYESGLRRVISGELKLVFHPRPIWFLDSTYKNNY